MGRKVNAIAAKIQKHRRKIEIQNIIFKNRCMVGVFRQDLSYPLWRKKARPLRTVFNPPECGYEYL